MSGNKNTFSQHGYKVIKNAISPKLIKETQIKILEKITETKKISNLNETSLYKKFKNCVDKLNSNEFDFISQISNYLIYSNQISKILKEKKNY